jgi:hypothetical protein
MYIIKWDAILAFQETVKQLRRNPSFHTLNFLEEGRTETPDISSMY